jgi:glycopeptide antibiotics resistance protein
MVSNTLRYWSKFLLIVYFSLLCWLWFFHPSREKNSEIYSTVHLIPFKNTSHSFDKVIKYSTTKYKWHFIESFIRNFFGNFFLFTPLIFLLALNYPWLRGYWPVLFVSLLLSFTAESLQYAFQIGFFEVDDIILNVAGAILGFWIYEKLELCLFVKLGLR